MFRRENDEKIWIIFNDIRPFKRFFFKGWTISRKYACNELLSSCRRKPLGVRLCNMTQFR